MSKQPHLLQLQAQYVFALLLCLCPTIIPKPLSPKQPTIVALVTDLWSEYVMFYDPRPEILFFHADFFKFHFPLLKFFETRTSSEITFPYS